MRFLNLLIASGQLYNAFVHADNDITILNRLVTSSINELTLSTAKLLLTIKFDDADIDRMNELGELAREGKLTPEQSNEIESYVRVGHFISILQSKARVTLKKARGLCK